VRTRGFRTGIFEALAPREKTPTAKSTSTRNYPSETLRLDVEMAASMEDQLLQLLADTQSAAQGPRKQAESHLEQLQSNEAFPTSLATIASHSSVSSAIRQSALSVLRRYVEHNWSGQGEDGPTITIPEHVKVQLRDQLLGLATSNEDDRKVRSAARYGGLCYT
jgi:importin-9